MFAKIISILMGLWHNPYIKAMVVAFYQTVASLPADLPQTVFELVTEAAVTQPNNSARFIFVLNALKTKYPTLPENTLRTLIENSLMAIKSPDVETPGATV